MKILKNRDWKPFGNPRRIFNQVKFTIICPSVYLGFSFLLKIFRMARCSIAYSYILRFLLKPKKLQKGRKRGEYKFGIILRKKRQRGRKGETSVVSCPLFIGRLSPSSIVKIQLLLFFRLNKAWIDKKTYCLTNRLII